MTSLPFIEALPADIDIPTLLETWNVSGPRYTSYPTAAEFTPDVGADTVIDAVTAPRQVPDPLMSLYVHVPFCSRKCDFCGCNSIVGAARRDTDDYLAHLQEEARLYKHLLPPDTRVVQFHVGGGTPTFLSDSHLQRLQDGLADLLIIDPGAERSIEVNPFIMSPSRVQLLKDMGFNRISLGVQDVNPRVLAAIGRDGDPSLIAAHVDAARAANFHSINIDMIYGLPGQTRRDFAHTLDALCQLRPDRIALYSFAYMPWLKPNQKRLPADLLPPPAEKLALFADAIACLTQAGYQKIGIDHFALATDELARARQAGQLSRNFMGYTVIKSPQMLGLGASAIGFLNGVYYQNLKALTPYQRALASARLPVEKGYRLTGDDALRAYIITQLMCNFAVEFTQVAKRFNVDMTAVFEKELQRLRDMNASGYPLVDITSDGLRLSGVGTLFVRNVCMVFDRYLTHRGGAKRFSRTI